MNFDFENNRPHKADVFFENAALRAETENYIDESLFVRLHFADLKAENAYLRETLVWEGSPILTLRECLGASWSQPDVSSASEEEIAEALRDLVERLRSLHQEIWRADHLSNRRLYQLLVKWVLPDNQKRLPKPPCPTVWTFEFFTEDRELDDADETIWLTYYATAEERRCWAQDRNATPPPRLTPPYAGRFTSLNGGCGCESVD